MCVTISRIADNPDNLHLQSDDINQCLINQQIIETHVNDDDKQSTSTPEVNFNFSFLCFSSFS